MTLSEPATLATDYLMAGLAGYWAFKLWGKDSFKTWWSPAFGFLAVASWVGGSYHGFQDNFPSRFSAGLWQATMLLSALSSLIMFWAGTRQFGGSRREKVWKLVGIAKFLVSVGFGFAKPTFLIVLIDFGFSMGIVSGLAIYRRRRNPRASRFFLYGVGLFVIGALIQGFQMSPSHFFNHNDLFHVVQIIANGLFYLCAVESQKSGPS